MKEKVRKALEAWNEFIRGFQKARDGWEKFHEIVGAGRLSLEEFPLEAQRALTRCNPKAKFTVALPRFADYVRRYADVNDMIFPVEEEKPEKEKPKTEKDKPKTSNKRNL